MTVVQEITRKPVRVISGNGFSAWCESTGTGLFSRVDLARKLNAFAQTDQSLSPSDIFNPNIAQIAVSLAENIEGLYVIPKGASYRDERVITEFGRSGLISEDDAVKAINTVYGPTAALLQHAGDLAKFNARQLKNVCCKQIALQTVAGGAFGFSLVYNDDANRIMPPRPTSQAEKRVGPESGKVGEYRRGPDGRLIPF